MWFTGNVKHNAYRLSDEEQKIVRTAKQWQKRNQKTWKALCDPHYFPAETSPVTVFLAGTPGAGKTEFSKSLIKPFEQPIIRLDADEIRDMMREIGYNGSNAHLFQDVVGGIVSNLTAKVLKNSQSVVIDGTFAYSNWQQKVASSLQHGRLIEIYYLYQDPIVAWRFVKARETKQGRYVPLDIFIQDYLLSINNVEEAKQTYGNKITLYFVKHNYENNNKYVIINTDSVVKHLPNVYTTDELRQQLEGLDD